MSKLDKYFLNKFFLLTDVCKNLLFVVIVTVSNANTTAQHNLKKRFQSFNTARIKKATIHTEGLKFRAFIYDIDSNYVYRFDNKEDIPLLLHSGCEECYKLSVDEIEKVNFSETNFREITSYFIGFAGLSIAVYLYQIDHGCPACDNFGNVFLGAGLVALIPGIAARIAPPDHRIIEREELEKQNFSDSDHLILYRGYMKTLQNQINYLKTLPKYIEKNPHKKIEHFQIRTNENNIKEGFIVKIVKDLIYLSDDYDSIIDMRINQEETDIVIRMGDILMINKLN